MYNQMLLRHFIINISLCEMEREIERERVLKMQWASHIGGRNSIALVLTNVSQDLDSKKARLRKQSCELNPGSPMYGVGVLTRILNFKQMRCS